MIAAGGSPNSTERLRQVAARKVEGIKFAAIFRSRTVTLSFALSDSQITLGGACSCSGANLREIGQKGSTLVAPKAFRLRLHRIEELDVARPSVETAVGVEKVRQDAMRHPNPRRRPESIAWRVGFLTNIVRRGKGSAK